MHKTTKENGRGGPNKRLNKRRVKHGHFTCTVMCVCVDDLERYGEFQSGTDPKGT